MKPLHVALVTKGISAARFERDDRPVGFFSYTVPEFTWEHVPVFKKAAAPLDTQELAGRGFDLVFHEDGAWRKYVGDALPVLYYVIDSTLSDDLYRQRLEQARPADLVLVDHDGLERFAETGKPVRRWSYCANDRLFRPLPKDADVASHFNAGGLCAPDREALGANLGRWCGAMGYSYRGGTLGAKGYARSLGGARICANWPRVPGNRPHRLFDGMAARSCVVTGPVPDVSGEARQAGRDYVEVHSREEFYFRASTLLDGGGWEEIAENGYHLVRERHTWAVRAAELRQILNEVFGL